MRSRDFLPRMNKKVGNRAQAVKQKFRDLDRSGDGKLDLEELSAAEIHLRSIGQTQCFQAPMWLIFTLRDPLRPGPAHLREHGESASNIRVGFRVSGSAFMVYGLGFRVTGYLRVEGLGLKVHGLGFRVFGFRVQGSSQTLKQKGGRGSGREGGGGGGGEEGGGGRGRGGGRFNCPCSWRTVRFQIVVAQGGGGGTLSRQNSGPTIGFGLGGCLFSQPLRFWPEASADYVNIQKVPASATLCRRVRLGAVGQLFSCFVLSLLPLIVLF